VGTRRYEQCIALDNRNAKAFSVTVGLMQQNLVVVVTFWFQLQFNSKNKDIFKSLQVLWQVWFDSSRFWSVSTFKSFKTFKSLLYLVTRILTAVYKKMRVEFDQSYHVKCASNPCVKLPDKCQSPRCCQTRPQQTSETAKWRQDYD